MIPVKQTFRHDPASGSYGDCMRAAIASVLELPIGEVPHFGEGGPPDAEFDRRVKGWLLSAGVPRFVFAQPSGDDPAEGLRIALNNAKACNPGTWWTLGGTSSNGVGHEVVCYEDEIVHDPSLDLSGIVGPLGGFYWLTFYGSMVTLKEREKK